MVTFDALNLTDQATQHSMPTKPPSGSYQYHETGRIFYLGVKYTY